MWKLGGLGWKRLLRRVWNQFWEDRALNQSAVLSFYFVLAIFPFLLFIVALLGMMLQSGPALHSVLHHYLGAVVPRSASGVIDSTLQEIRQSTGGGKLFFGLLFAIWATSQGMLALIDVLDITYDVRESRQWWRRYLLAFFMTIGAFVLMSVALVTIGYGGHIADFLAAHIGFSGIFSAVWSAAEWIFLLFLVLLAFNILYIVAPNIRHREWHWMMPGTVAGVALWLLVSYGFKIYLSFFNMYSATYGSIGAVIILLLWFYLTGLAIIVGGEVNSEIEKAKGKVEKPPEARD